MRRRLLLSFPVVALALTVAAAPAVAANPPVTDVDRTLVQRVPDYCITGIVASLTPASRDCGNGVRAGGMSGLEIVGSDAYAIKSTADGWANFYHIDDFDTAGATMGVRVVRLPGSSTAADLGHPNGLAYYPDPSGDPTAHGSFYIPMLKAKGDKQIAQVNNQGIITAQYGARLAGSSGATGTKSIASISYYRNQTFIVRTNEKIPNPDDANEILQTYYVATRGASDFLLDPAKRFYVPTTVMYETGQDVVYIPSDDQLLVPVWGGGADGTAYPRNNRIIVVDVGTITTDRVYEPVRWIRLNVAASDADKFEVEGLDRDSSGRLHVASNIVAPSGTHIDGIHRLVGR